MNNLLINHYYCPEDKDILDFVKSVQVSREALVAFLVKRGVYVSDNARKEDLAIHISSEVYTLQDVTELLALLTTPLKKENFVTGNHQSKAEFELLEQAVKNVQTFRLNKYGDKVSLTATGTSQYQVAIEYTQIDYEKTRLIQGVERDAEISFKKSHDGFVSRRTSDERSREIEMAILGEYERLARENEHDLLSSKLLISRLLTINSRISFFKGLMENISGYEFEGIVSARVASIDKPEVVLDSDIDEVAKKYTASIESLVINGRNVSNTALYDKYVGKEFYPMTVTWIVASDTGDIRKAEIRAAFVPVADDHELQFSTLAVWPFRSGELQPKEKPSPITTSAFSELLRISAEDSMNKSTEEGV